VSTRPIAIVIHRTVIESIGTIKYDTAITARHKPPAAAGNDTVVNLIAVGGVIRSNLNFIAKGGNGNRSIVGKNSVETNSIWRCASIPFVINGERRTRRP